MANDITKSETVKAVHEDDEGTGIYWFVDANDQYEQVFVPDITRDRAKELADDFDKLGQGSKRKLDAYRWVPKQVETAQSLVGKACGGKCDSDLDCVDSSCRCISGRCRRK